MSSVNSLLNSLVTQQTQSLNQTLSKDQLTKLNDILSKYDAKNFTQADFQNLGKQLQQAGIGPSKQVQSAIAAKGIDVSQYVQNAAPPQTSNPSGSSAHGPAYKLDLSQIGQQIVDNSNNGNGPTLTDAQKTSIKDIFAKYKDAPQTQDTFDKIHTDLQAAGVAPEQLGGANPPADGANSSQAEQSGGQQNHGKGTPPPKLDGGGHGGGGGGGGGVTVDNSGAVNSAKEKVIPQVGVTGANEVVDSKGDINTRLLNQLLQQQQQQENALKGGA